MYISLTNNCDRLHGREVVQGSSRSGSCMKLFPVVAGIEEPHRPGACESPLPRSAPEATRSLLTGSPLNTAPTSLECTAEYPFSHSPEASSDVNFASIVKGIMRSRCVNDAVRKLPQFRISTNITAVIITFVSAVASEEEESVLTAVQLLWVNIIMDTFAALALATDPATKSLLDRKLDTHRTRLFKRSPPI